MNKSKKTTLSDYLITQGKRLVELGESLILRGQILQKDEPLKPPKKVKCYNDPIWMDNARKQAEEHHRKYHKRMEAKLEKERLLDGSLDQSIKAKPQKRIPLHKNPIYMAQVKERIDQHKRAFHAKRDKKLGNG